MRAFLLILVLLPALPAGADVIHLKNGRTIWADQVRETKDHIEYDLGEDTYAIPKASVDRIEAAELLPVAAVLEPLTPLTSRRLRPHSTMKPTLRKRLLGMARSMPMPSEPSGNRPIPKSRPRHHSRGQA